MLKIHNYCSSLIILILSLSTALAQNEIAKKDNPDAVGVTASASGDRVRFAAPSSVVRIRLEVYNSTGQRVFDNELKGGNVLDWQVQDAQAVPLADGSYLCAVTVQTVDGRISKRIGSAIVEKSAVTLQAAVPSQLSPQQSEVIGPIEDGASLILLKDDENRTTTVIAHNGEDGQMTRGRGALSFRVGDFFRGKDIEQMRLTADGNLGIGVTNPQAKLDVAGAIRATQGIIFPDGTIQFSAARRTFGAPSQRGSQLQDLAQEEPRPSLSGAGTTGQIPKWVDGPSGALGDSVITELNGNIGINGPPSPIYKLDVNGHNRFRGSNVSFYLTGSKPTGNEWVFQTVDADGRLRIFDNTSGTEPLSLTQSGNLGLGAATPAARVHVRANLGNVLIGDPGCNPGFGAIGFGGSMTGCSNYSLLGEGVNTYLNRPPGGSILFRENNITQMTISTGGNVGIGTLTPATVTGGRVLHIEGVVSALRLGATNQNGNQWEWQSNALVDSAAMILYNATTFTNAMTVLGNGKVGIGTITPGGKLQVLTAPDGTPSVIPAWDSRHFVVSNGNQAGSRIPGIGMSYDPLNNFGFINALTPSEGAWGNLVLQSGPGNVGIGTSAADTKLTVNGGISLQLFTGGATQLCQNAQLRIATCSSSIRYKSNIKDFSPGLNLVNRLRPVSFTWKEDGMLDLGLVAEEVASVEPLLTTRNDKGEIEGVKYDRVGVVLLNAVKEQQSQIAYQQEQIKSQSTLIKQQQAQLEGLKRLVCESRPNAKACN